LNSPPINEYLLLLFHACCDRSIAVKETLA
jgi:hypothetical protein